MSDSTYYSNVVQGELTLAVQDAVKRGWTFGFEAGERKFGWCSLTATKGDHKVSGSCPDDLWDQISRIDFPER